MANDRRDFLKTIGGLTAAAVAGPACAPGSTDARPAGAAAATGTAAEAAVVAGRPGGAAKYALELDGSFAGWLQSFEGGYAVGDVVTEKIGPDHYAKKHIGAVKYEDITVTCGTGMSKAFYEWIRDTLDHRYTRRSGVVRGADQNLRERSRLEFANALISEVGMPALDGSSKDTANLTVKFSPEYTRRKAGSGATVKFTAESKVHRTWLSSSFNLAIAGLEDATSRALKIEAITIKQSPAEDPIGDARDYVKEPASLEFPNLVVTLAESSSGSFYDWHEDFVIRGYNGDERERGGSLEYSDQQGRPFFTLTFQNLGVFKVAPDKAEAGGEGIRRVKAEMYCEQMKFDFSASGA